MSRYEWEHGTITLPSAAVSGLKKTLRDWSNQLHADVRAEAIRLHVELAKRTRSVEKYRERLNADLNAHRHSGVSLGSRDRRYDEMTYACARQVLDLMLVASTYGTGPAPHQPTVADVKRVAPKLSNRDDTFLCLSIEGFSEAIIRFDGRIVTWDVSENNHAVDRARGTHLAAIFFAALDRMVWTRGTGGDIVGNDEYNEDDRSVGGGGNYITASYGPATASRTRVPRRRAS